MNDAAPPSTAANSVGDWLKLAVTRLQTVSESPQLDAEILLNAVTGIHRTRIHAWPDTALSPEQLEDLQPILERRVRGEPLAYITRTAEFWSLPLCISPAVLIPRPETELLVECSLEQIPLNDPSAVLELGTGSGAIALALAQARPHASVLAVDISTKALEIATKNAHTHTAANLTLQQSDWYASLGDQRFDVIVSNPPYVADNDPDLAPAVAQYEPTLAVVAGPTGLEALSHIIRHAAQHLQPNGHLLLEHGWKQAAEVRTLLVQQGFSRVRSHRDLAGHERVSEGCLAH
jgi:release factor glutamine methyltransferase